MISNFIKEFKFEFNRSGFSLRSKAGKTENLMVKAVMIAVFMGVILLFISAIGAALTPDLPESWGPDEKWDPPSWFGFALLGGFITVITLLYVWLGSMMWQIRSRGAFEERED